jgi:hypothetical protein
MKKVILFTIMLFFITNAFAKDKEIAISCSESDAQIYQDGKLVGTGSATIIIKKYSQSTVIAKKEGFFDFIQIFYNDNDHPKPPSSFLITMIKDDAFESSSSSDIANNDIDIMSSKNEDKAWKLLSEVITSYFDILEVTDKSTGYIRTSWVVQSFKTSTVRTRVIIKTSSSENSLKYKIKILSEIADHANTSVKEDEKFKSWSRILKKYNDLISELQSRLK